VSKRERALIIILVVAMALSNLFISYQIIDLQSTVTHLFEKVYMHEAILQILDLFQGNRGVETNASITR
jgi:cell division protein FtsL